MVGRVPPTAYRPPNKPLLRNARANLAEQARAKLARTLAKFHQMDQQLSTQVAFVLGNGEQRIDFGQRAERDAEAMSVLLGSGTSKPFGYVACT